MTRLTRQPLKSCSQGVKDGIAMQPDAMGCPSMGLPQVAECVPFISIPAHYVETPLQISYNPAVSWLPTKGMSYLSIIRYCVSLCHIDLVITSHPPEFINIRHQQTINEASSSIIDMSSPTIIHHYGYGHLQPLDSLSFHAHV